MFPCCAIIQPATTAECHRNVADDKDDRQDARTLMRRGERDHCAHRALKARTKSDTGNRGT